MSLSAHIDTLISDKSLIQTLSEMVNIASPTGEERALAEHISVQLNAYGIEASVQSISDKQANAFGVRRTQGADKSLMLYAPIDTVSSNNEAEDLPWLGPNMRDDFRAKAYVKDDHIFGLGAHNPKGHGACILEAARVLDTFCLLYTSPSPRDS